MALIICTECGKKFSDKAGACPECGCPVSAMETEVSDSAVSNDIGCYNGSQVLYDIAGDTINPQQLLDAYENSFGMKIYFNKYTNYSSDEYSTVISYILANLTKSDMNFFQRTALAANLEQGPRAFLSSQKKETQAQNKKLSCPECGGHNVDIYDEAMEYKTNISLNPLHPFTLTKTKKVQKKKLSAAKLGLGLATGGVSLLATGAHSKVKKQWYCKECGCVFER